MDLERHRPRLVRLFEEEIPFNRMLGIRLRSLEPGTAVIHLPWRDAFVGDPDRPAVHGGITSALVDTAGGAACFSMLEGLDERVSTVDLRIDYLRPGPPDDLECFAKVLRMGNRVAVARMEVRVPSAGSPNAPVVIASGQGVYNVIRRPRDPSV